MTEPGRKVYPAPGWWPRTNRVGIGEENYGFLLHGEGFTPRRGGAGEWEEGRLPFEFPFEFRDVIAFTHYGWVTSAVGETPHHGEAEGSYAWEGTAVGEHTVTALTAYVATQEYTNAQAWTDLTTTTDYVTFPVPASGIVGVSISAWMSTSSVTFISYALSGANTRSADFDRCFSYWGGDFIGHGGVFLETGLTPGETTFKMKYNAATSYIEKRRITVFRLEG